MFSTRCKALSTVRPAQQPPEGRYRSAGGGTPVTAAQLRAFGDAFGDLGDETVMSGAWT